MSNETVAVVVAWHNPEQLERFKQAWRVEEDRASDVPVIFQEDKFKDGCAATKNKGIAEAVRRGFDIVVVLDDDCFPATGYGPRTFTSLASAHVTALKPVEIPSFKPVTNPASRGTPYTARTITMPVAASMGFWTEVGDYDACAQLVRGARTPMTFDTAPVFGQYFPLCGMNLAFRPKEWICNNGGNYWWQFIDVPRFDDIWMGWLWQREAYRRGYCFNLAGPLVRHSRQSNVWQNLRDEAIHLERNETLWHDIATAPLGDYANLRKLLPV